MATLDHTEIFKSEDASNTLIVLFIPGKDKNNNDLPDQELWATAAGRLMGTLFGGVTRMPTAFGGWLNPETNELITEPVILIHSYVRAADIASREKLDQLAHFLHRMGKETKQGEVAVLITPPPLTPPYEGGEMAGGQTFDFLSCRANCQFENCRKTNNGTAETRGCATSSRPYLSARIRVIRGLSIFWLRPAATPGSFRVPSVAIKSWLRPKAALGISSISWFPISESDLWHF